MGPRLALFGVGAVHVTEHPSVRPHRAQAWKLVVALDGVVEVRTRRGAYDARAVVVPPYVAQSMERRGPTVAYFAEPGSLLAPFGAGQDDVLLLGGRHADDVVAIAREAAAAPGDDAFEATRHAFRRLALPAPPAVDARVLRALDTVAAAPSITVSAVATHVGLSEVRLRHLVRSTTHLSLRTHRLWHRTMHAIEAVATGRSPAQAAASAGFADQPHFARAFAAFFGRTPGSLKSEHPTVTTSRPPS